MSRQYQQSHGLLKCESSMREIQIPTTAKAHRIFHHLPGKNELRKKSVRFGDSTTQNSDIEKLTSHLAKRAKIVEICVPGWISKSQNSGVLKIPAQKPWKIVLRANFFPVGIGKWGNQLFQQNNKKNWKKWILKPKYAMKITKYNSPEFWFFLISTDHKENVACFSANPCNLQLLHWQPTRHSFCPPRRKSHEPFQWMDPCSSLAICRLHF